MGFPLLTALVVLPALGAALVVAIPRTRPELIRVVGFTVAMAASTLAARKQRVWPAKLLQPELAL